MNQEQTIINNIKDSISSYTKSYLNYFDKDFRNSKLNANDIRIMLENNNPPIMVSTEKWETDLTEAKNDVIVLGPGGLQKGEAEVISEALRRI